MLLLITEDMHDRVVTLVMRVRIDGVRRRVNVWICRLVMKGDGVGTIIVGGVIRDGSWAILFSWVG